MTINLDSKGVGTIIDRPFAPVGADALIGPLFRHKKIPPQSVLRRDRFFV